MTSLGSPRILVLVLIALIFVCLFVCLFIAHSISPFRRPVLWPTTTRYHIPTSYQFHCLADAAETAHTPLEPLFAFVPASTSAGLFARGFLWTPERKWHGNNANSTSVHYQPVTGNRQELIISRIKTPFPLELSLG